MPRVVELGGEECRVEGRITVRDGPRERTDREKQVFSFVEEAEPVFGRRFREVDREIAISKILDQGCPEFRRVRVERGHAYPGGVERRADRGPIRLREGRGLRVEDEKRRRAARRGLPEIAPGTDVAGQRGRGRRCGEAEAFTRLSDPLRGVLSGGRAHPFFAGAGGAAVAGAALSSRISTFTSFW